MYPSDIASSITGHHLVAFFVVANFATALRLACYRRDGARYRPGMSVVAYLMFVFTGGQALDVLVRTARCQRGRLVWPCCWRCWCSGRAATSQTSASRRGRGRHARSGEGFHGHGADGRAAPVAGGRQPGAGQRQPAGRRAGALQGASQVADLAKPGTKLAIYRFGRSLDDDARFWFHWLHDTDARGAIPDDAQERTYFTEAGQPRATDSTMATSSAQMPTAWYRHTGGDGARHRDRDPQPNPRRTWSASPASWPTPLCRPGARRPPNQVSDPFNGHERHAQRYQHGRAAGRGIQHHAQAAVYLDDRRDGHGDPALLKEIPAGAVTFSDKVDFTLLGEALPERALARRRRICSGSWPIRAASWSDSPASACTAEVFKPHGWPYYSPVADEIVGGAVMGQATVICTKGDTTWRRRPTRSR